MTVFDVTLFNGEIDMLLARLRELAPHVDVFLVCESSETFSGRPRSLGLLAELPRLQAAAAPSVVLPGFAICNGGGNHQGFYAQKQDGISPSLTVR